MTDGRKNMSKYDKMVALNKKASDEKVERARRTIITMVDEGEKINIPKLMERTGLSRGFFYKNPVVRKELDRAMELQVGMQDPRRNILDMAMEGEIQTLQHQITLLKREKEELEKENIRLREALSRKNFTKLKNSFEST